MNAIIPGAGPPTLPSGGVLSLLGVSGWALEWKHGWAVVTGPFSGCYSVMEVLGALERLEDATFAGIIVFAALLVASTVSLAMGLRRSLSSALKSNRDEIVRRADTATPRPKSGRAR